MSWKDFQAVRRELNADQQRIYTAICVSINEWVTADFDEIVELCSRLIQAPSPSEAKDVRDCMAIVKSFCQNENLPFQAVDYSRKLQNMISTAELCGSGAHLMFNGHLDTMPAGKEPGWKDDPYSGA